MKENNIQQALEAIAGQTIPENIDLWPGIAAGVNQPEKSRRKAGRANLAWSIVLVLLGLIMISGAAYALFRIFSDPGLNAVDEAGLARTMQVSAAPTVLPATTPMLPDPGQATLLSQSQSIDGVTLTLEWVYIENNRTSLGASLNSLPTGVSVGMPLIDFAPLEPRQKRGEVLAILPQGDTLQLLYSANLVLNESLADGNVPLTIEIPLLSDGGDESNPPAVFRFEPAPLPLNRGRAHGFFDYEVTSSNVSMRLESLCSDRDVTRAKICFSAPGSENNWSIHTARLQYSQETLPGAAENEMLLVQSIFPLPESDELQCLQATFPAAAGASDRSLLLQVNDLVAENGEVRNGSWRFQASLPDLQDIPGLAVPTATPEPTLISQMVGDLTATLNWAYADASRVAFEFHFDGWRNEYRTSLATLTDSQGVPLGDGFLQPVEGDPASGVMVLQPLDASVLQTDEIYLQIDLPVYQTQDPAQPLPEQPLASFHFDLSLPVYPATELAPALETAANDIPMKLVQVSSSPSYTEANLCFLKPSDSMPSDWIIGRSAALTVGERETGIDSYSLLYDAGYGLNDTSWMADTETLPSGWRCVRLGFPLGHHNQNNSLEIHIPFLELSSSGEIPTDQLQAANQQLEQEGLHIEFESVSGSGGGGGSWSFTQKPDGMDEQQAMQRLMEILGYYYPGPWNFTIEVKPEG